MRTLEAHLVFDAASFPALIGRSSSPEALRVLASLLLEEAEQRVESCRALDEPVLLANQEAELGRLRAVLNALLPDVPKGGP